MLKILLLGDSITAGIGSKKVSYEKMLEHKCRERGLDVEIKNYACSGSTIEYPIKIIRKLIDYDADYVIVFYGNVDVRDHYDLSKNRYGLVSLTPKRYKKIGSMLNPRPYNSSKLWKRVIHIVDNFYRRVWRSVIIKTQGTRQLLTVDQFIDIYETLIYGLKDTNLMLCSTVYPDSEIYGNNNVEIYDKTNHKIEEIASKVQNAVYIDLWTNLKKTVLENGWDSCYYNDHLHPNFSGYEVISSLLSETIINSERN